MENLYQLLTVEDVHKDEASIIGVLEAIQDRSLPNDLRLLNYYKELPVNFAATIETIDRGVVEMTVHELQSISMLMQKATFIKSAHLPYTVISKVLRVKREKKLVYLNQFSYVHIPAERRLSVRVKLSEKLDASFQNNQQMVRGSIEDISFGGVSIIAPKGSVLEENVTGMLSIWLPDTKLEVQGKLLKVHDEENSNRFVFELELDNKSERLMSQFIFRQQSQIIRELKEMSTFGSNM
jgi:c-di-GMP-binding flagellar brake protein YcgR